MQTRSAMDQGGGCGFGFGGFPDVEYELGELKEDSLGSAAPDDDNDNGHDTDQDQLSAELLV